MNKARVGASRSWARDVPASLVTTGATLLLWVLVVVGTVTGPLALVRPMPKAEARPAAVETPAGAEGFAELYVVAYLRAGEGTEATLKPFFPTQIDLRGTTAASNLAVRTAVVGTRPVGPDYWSVVVAAEYSPGDNVVQRFFQVGVLVVDDKLFVASSLPAEIAAPLGARSPKLAGGGLERPATDDPVVDATGRFLSALLAGDGDLSRYLAPKVSLSPVRPPAYASVALRRMAARKVSVPEGQLQTTEVIAEVAGTTPGGRIELLHYALRLTLRGGRWEVAELLPAPTLSDEQRDLTPDTTAPPTASTTSTTRPFRAPTTTTSERRTPS